MGYISDPVGDCQRLLGTTAPVPYAGHTPWGETPESETPESMDGCLAGRDYDNADGADETVEVGEDEYACACSLLSNGQGVILPANLMLMGIGILLLLARGRKIR